MRLKEVSTPRRSLGERGIVKKKVQGKEGGGGGRFIGKPDRGGKGKVPRTCRGERPEESGSPSKCKEK